VHDAALRNGRQRILVDVAEQRLRLVAGDVELAAYRVTTSRHGTGQLRGSHKTPLGIHEIRAKIGAGAPLGTVFVGRRPTGEIYSTELAAAMPERDWILTRILWLSGREVGFNRLGAVDTMRRYIYIHGAPRAEVEAGIGSIGCVRMSDEDVADLFERVPVGTVVEIK
jgi:lipoprotein-anchoring transpeptidase ErfK/SrfK